MNRAIQFDELFACDVKALKLAYDSRRPDGGEAFEDALQASIARLIQFPLSSPEWKDGLRTALVSKRYPYIIVYRVSDTTIRFSGVFPARQPRSRWPSR